MTKEELNKLGTTLWGIADDLRGAMNADDFRDYMLSFLFLRYLSDNYETAAQKELGADYPTLKEGDKRAPLAEWYEKNLEDVSEFEKHLAFLYQSPINICYQLRSLINKPRVELN